MVGHQSTVDTCITYLQTLASYHTGEALLQGISEFRPLVDSLVTGDVLHADGIVGAIAMVLMAGILVVGVQEGAVRARVLYAAPPLVACWSLMTFYHLTYGFVILLPVLMLLALNDTPPSALRRRLFWLLQLGMMFDVPSLSRLAGLAETALFRIVLVHTDRALLAVLFFGLIALAVRERQSTMRATASRLGLLTGSSRSKTRLSLAEKFRRANQLIGVLLDDLAQARRVVLLSCEKRRNRLCRGRGVVAAEHGAGPVERKEDVARPLNFSQHLEARLDEFLRMAAAKGVVEESQTIRNPPLVLAVLYPRKAREEDLALLRIG